MVNFIANPESFYDNPLDKLSKVGCSVPARHFEIHTDGSVSACCLSWLPIRCGNILVDSIDDIINNSIRKDIVNKMSCGNFDHCNDLCPQLSTFLKLGLNKRHNWSFSPKELLQKKIDERPYQIYFSYDASCNLQCPSCRNSLILYKLNDTSDNAINVRTIHEKTEQLVEKLLSTGDEVILSITGSGDAFASPVYWNYLKKLSTRENGSNLKINLMTNGLLMTEAHWNQIKPLWKHILFLNISVDAATEETYKIVRKGGQFKKLKNNLDYLDKFISDGNLPNLNGWQSNIIVQKDNFHELKQFVEWQLCYKNVTHIWTNLVTQWYHMDDEQFNNMAVWKEGHSMRSQLIEILKDPIFKNNRIIFGNMSSLIKELD